MLQNTGAGRIEIPNSALLPLLILDRIPHGGIEIDVEVPPTTGAGTSGSASESGVDNETAIKERQVIKGIIRISKGIDPLTNVEGFVLHFVDEIDWIRRRMHVVASV